MNLHGLDILIETPRGRSRTGLGKDGKRWVGPPLPCAYGEIKRTRAADGDRVDAYVGSDRNSNKVFVIDQIDAKTKKYDEAKVMLGFSSKSAALADYEKAFSDGKAKDRIGAVTEMTVEGFKDWLKSGDTKKPVGTLRKAYADGGSVENGLDVARKLTNEDRTLDILRRRAAGEDVATKREPASWGRALGAVADKALLGIPSSLYWLGTGDNRIKSKVEDAMQTDARELLPREALNALEVPNPASVFSSLGPALGKAASYASDALPSIGAAAMFLGPKAKLSLPMDRESRMGRAADMGFGPDTWYHGSNRIDRVVEKGALDPRRASSGPMPYFTSQPEIASNYAKGKPDLSLMDDGDIAKYFTVAPKDLGIKSARSPIPVEKSWHWLSPENKAEILSRAKRIGYENPAEASGPIILHPEGVEASISPSQFDYYMKTSARGNPLSALRELWHDSGELVGSEPELEKIWRLAGYPHPISQYSAPWTTHEGVLPTKIRMKNPLVTENVAELKDKVIPALQAAFKRDRTRLQEFGNDSWDKNARYTPRQWVEELDKDVGSGKNSYVWTSIPDKVTAELRRLGYDGIVDVGGKMGGETHKVAIPFSPEQVRSVNAKFDPAKIDSKNLLASRVAPIVGAGAAAAAAYPGDPEPPYANGGKTPMHRTWPGTDIPLPPGVDINARGVPYNIHTGHPVKKKHYTAREDGRASGGSVERALDTARRYASGGKVHVGPVVGATGGREDALPVSVPAGAFVVPADVVSSLGSGNTLAGMKKLEQSFGKAQTARAAGGAVPILISDGEFVIPPEQVAKIGSGNMDTGHKILDQLMMRLRKQHIDTLRSLPPPAK